MTAQIVTHYTREALYDAGRAAFLTQWHDADITARERESFPWGGQLWERVAEDIHNPSVITLGQYARIGEFRGKRSVTWGLTSIDDE